MTAFAYFIGGCEDQVKRPMPGGDIPREIEMHEAPPISVALGVDPSSLSPMSYEVKKHLYRLVRVLDPATGDPIYIYLYDSTGYARK
jgi:hypothetical protein